MTLGPEERGIAPTSTLDGFDFEGSDPVGLAELARGLAERNAQLQRALDSRIVIEQAKGMLAERFRLPTDQAFELLRRAARNHRIRVHVLAAKVVEQPETPDELAEVIPR